MLARNRNLNNYLFIYYETGTKVHEKEKKEKEKKHKETQTIENIQKIQKTHITKNTSHGAYKVHN